MNYEEIKTAIDNGKKVIIVIAEPEIVEKAITYGLAMDYAWSGKIEMLPDYPFPMKLVTTLIKKPYEVKSLWDKI
ncbi:MAG: hypothetical protein DRQ46_00585 [Gammaproteobacteria bacterium]|nr:MAG: hypothetical protein DRQ46_00585 [Gammaproteobacteria bacterium]